MQIAFQIYILCVHRKLHSVGTYCLCMGFKMPRILESFDGVTILRSW